MAHHNRTPRAVLDAPKRTVEYVVRHTGQNRRDRRHDIIRPSGKHVFIAKAKQAPATNRPYVKPVTP